MAAAREALAARGCSVLVVAQARPEVLSQYLARGAWPVPLVSDPERAAYAAFGLGRVGWLTFFKPRVLWGYLKKMFQGHGVKKPYAGEDVLQLGGDFIVSRDRGVIFAHPSADPTDRPAIADLLVALPSATPIVHELAPNGTRVDGSAPGG